MNGIIKVNRCYQRNVNFFESSNDNTKDNYYFFAHTKPNVYTLFQVNPSDFTVISIRSVDDQTNLNVFEYNSDIIYLYKTKTSKISMLNKIGVFEDLPLIPNLPAINFTLGCLDSNNYLYLKSNNDDRMFIIDLNFSSPTFNQLTIPKNSFEKQNNPFQLLTKLPKLKSIAFNKKNKQLYAIDAFNNILKIDPITFKFSKLDFDKSYTSINYDKLFFDSEGKMCLLDYKKELLSKYTLFTDDSMEEDITAPLTYINSPKHNPIISNFPHITLKSHLNNYILKDLKDYCSINNTLTNIGNTPSGPISFSIKLPSELSFSDANAQTHNPNYYPIENINPGESVNLSFKIKPNCIPQKNKYNIESSIKYNYLYQNKKLTKYANTLSDLYVNISELSISSTFYKKTSPLGDILKYTVKIENIGNSIYKNAIFKNTINERMNIVPDSIRINNKTPTNLNIDDGILLGNLKSKEVVILSFLGKTF